ncbi:MAG: biopolymer transporter ExbD [Proteobacteria bacterium]|nr:biopolymer transporter ExbD [Pseudomonadota bacterium]
MDLEFRPRRKQRRMNLTPLVDVSFTLVLFFMITTTFGGKEAIELGFGVSAPQEIAKMDESKILAVTLRDDKRFLMNGSLYEGKQFSEKISRILHSDPKKMLILRADKDVSAQGVVAAMDLIRMAGGSNVTLAE